MLNFSSNSKFLGPPPREGPPPLEPRPYMKGPKRFCHEKIIEEGYPLHQKNHAIQILFLLLPKIMILV